jgi:hypothetical protein
MSHLNSSKLPLRACLGFAAVVAVLCTASLTFVTAADPPAANTQTAATNAPVTQASEPKAAAAEPAPPAKKTEKKSLTGAELYQVNCNRCHSERYATEFTSAQWKTLMIHMRVRANLPAAQAREILKYLQEDSGN